MKIETPQAGGPYELSLSDGKELKLHNILIGEVWICSGQSNMEMPMKGFKAQPVAGTPEELMLCKDQQLRLLRFSAMPSCILLIRWLATGRKLMLQAFVSLVLLLIIMVRRCANRWVYQ